MNLIQVNVAKATGLAAFGNLIVPAPADTCDAVPEVDPDYHFAQDSVVDFLVWYQDVAADLLAEADGELPMADANRKGWWLSGPKGTGKTTCVEQLCARLQLPLIQVTARADMCWDELIVAKDLIGGDTVDVDGALTRAMRSGSIFMINEAGYLKSTETVALHDLVLRNRITIPGSGEVVVAKPGFGIVATSNSNGSGDTTGQYGGERRQNAAWMDRFYLSEVSYLPRDVEERIFAAKVPDLGDETRGLLLDVADMSRAAFNNPEGREAKTLEEQGGGVPDNVIDTRSLLSWGKVTTTLLQFAQMGVALSADPHYPVKRALDTVIANKGDPGARTAFRKMLDLKLGT